MFDEFRTKCHGASLTVLIEVTKDYVWENASGFPVLLDIPVNRTLAVGARDREFTIGPSRRVHQRGNNRYVSRALDDDLGVDVALHRLPGSQGNRATIDSVDALRLGQASADHGFDARVVRLRQ